VPARSGIRPRLELCSSYLNSVHYYSASAIYEQSPKCYAPSREFAFCETKPLNSFGFQALSMNQVPQAHASVLAQAGKRRSYCSIEIWGAYRRGHEFTWRQGLWTLKMILMSASEQGSHELSIWKADGYRHKNKKSSTITQKGREVAAANRAPRNKRTPSCRTSKCKYSSLISGGDVDRILRDSAMTKPQRRRTCAPIIWMLAA